MTRYDIKIKINSTPVITIIC